MTGLPVDVGICTVTGTLKSGEQIEGSDPDPDLASLSGYVKFNPSTTRTVHAGEELIIYLKPITAEVDENGYFETQLIATDDTDLNPHGWTYTVSFHLIGAKFPTFAIEAPQGQTVDLSSVVPVAVANGTTIIQGGPVGPTGDSAYDLAVAGGFVGDEAAWLASLEGSPGSPGADGASAYEVAVANGFVGTEAEWLASLGGVTGPILVSDIDSTGATINQVMLADGAGGVSWGDAPGGDLSGYYTKVEVDAFLQDTDAVIFHDGSVYPVRTSVTSDTSRRVRWVGPVEPTVGSPYAETIDVWENTA